jgi:hypothetical protein
VELNDFCYSVQYYSRKTGIRSGLGVKPYIVSSRISETLIANLLKDKHPILFEGLHTCGIIGDPRLKGRLLIYRESNIEHHYYYHLFKAEKAMFKKAFFLAESARLRLFQSNLKYATIMLAVSEDDRRYLSSSFRDHKVIHLPSFHGHDEPEILPGRGKYILYQGKLSVPENYKAVSHILSKIWRNDMPRLVIAGLDPPGWLKQMAMEKENVMLIENPKELVMNQLIKHAHINLMLTFQPTGLKLKLINALFRGRYCLVNPAMIAGTGLEPVCSIASSPEEFREQIIKLTSVDFTEEMAISRSKLLVQNYSDLNNCKTLADILTL